MAQLACQQLVVHVDMRLTEALNPTNSPITHPLGTHVRDRRKVAFIVHGCASKGSHRTACTFETMTRRYNTFACKQQAPLNCMACRICYKDATAWIGARGPSELERSAYALIDHMHARNYYIFTEWHVANTKKSIDVVLIHKADMSMRVAVHVDGRQHLDVNMAHADAAFDATLKAMGFKHVVRLAQDDMHDWIRLLTWHGSTPTVPVVNTQSKQSPVPATAVHTWNEVLSLCL